MQFKIRNLIVRWELMSNYVNNGKYDIHSGNDNDDTYDSVMVIIIMMIFIIIILIMVMIILVVIMHDDVDDTVDIMIRILIKCHRVNSELRSMTCVHAL